MFRGDPVAGPLDDFTAQVRSASHRITDEDIDRLREAGIEEDAIFESTLAAAIGAAAATLVDGLRIAGTR